MSNTNKKSKKPRMRSVLNWNSGGNLSSGGNRNDYLRYGSFSSAENATKIVIPADGVLYNFVAQLVPSVGSGNAAPGAGVIRTFIIRKNGVDTDLKIDITGTHSNGESNAEVAVKKFDQISLVHHSDNASSANIFGLASVILAHK